MGIKWKGLLRLSELEKKKLLDIVDGTRVIEGYGYEWVENVANYLIENGVILERTGHWIKQHAHDTRETWICCSECGYPTTLMWGKEKYCSNCGAKMDEEVRND